MGYRGLLDALAGAILAGHPEPNDIVNEVHRLLKKKWRWVRPLATRYLRAIGGRTRPRRSEVVRFLRQDRGFARIYQKYRHELFVAELLSGPKIMRPDPAAAKWNVPAITTVGDLAAWFGLNVTELEWFADVKGFATRLKAPAKTRHYSYRILGKQSGAIRLIESPKSRLKVLQRKVLDEILDRVPSHAAAHGFVKERSIKTFTALHLGRRVVLKMDLRDFFPSFRAARIQTVFRLLGYPEAVADLLAGLCCTATPRDVWRELPFDAIPQRWRESRDLYERTHLPQGAPTSPALANICCYRLDCRLSGLAAVTGASYTRYADDLAFSGDHELERRVELFADHVAVILMEEGFDVNFRKTRIMRRGVRQRLSGIVVNEHANVVRDDFDRLKATLTNCVRHGPESQNREAHPRWQAHLDGRVSFVEFVNPARGKRLREIYDRVRWE